MVNDKFGGGNRRSGYRKMVDARNNANRGRPIACDLTREQKAAAKGDFESVGLDMGELTDAITAGYKLSCTVGNDGRSFYATLTDKSDSSEFEGCWLTISASDPIEAIFRVLWVTGTLCNGDWSVLEQLSSEVGDDW